MEAVQLIADGKAPRIPQPEEGATYEGIQKKENAEVFIPTQLNHLYGPQPLSGSQGTSFWPEGRSPSWPAQPLLLLRDRNVSVAFDTVNIKRFSLCFVLS